MGHSRRSSVLQCRSRATQIPPFRTSVTEARKASAIHNLKSEYEHFDTISEDIFCSPWIKQRYNKLETPTPVERTRYQHPRMRWDSCASSPLCPAENYRRPERHSHSAELGGVPRGARGYIGVVPGSVSFSAAIKQGEGHTTRFRGHLVMRTQEKNISI